MSLLDSALSVPIVGPRSDALESEQLSCAKPFSSKKAANFPQKMREFVKELSACIYQWDQASESVQQLRALSDAEELLREADDLAREVSDHTGALMERLLRYREIVDPDLRRHEISSAIASTQADTLERIVAEGADDHLDPHGLFVYILWGDDGPVYVGQSSNVLGRLGNHMNHPEKRKATRSIQLIRCADRESMMDTERRLIKQYQPRFNIMGNPGGGPIEMLFP